MLREEEDSLNRSSIQGWVRKRSINKMQTNVNTVFYDGRGHVLGRLEIKTDMIDPVKNIEGLNVRYKTKVSIRLEEDVDMPKELSSLLEKRRFELAS